MKLVDSKDPILRTPCKDFNFTNPPFEPIEFATELVKFMRDHNGLGLAANQVGVGYKIFAMRSDPNKVFFNPRIIDRSEETILLEEGCLSFPDLFVKIKRPRHIKVRYEQPNGETVTETYVNLSARIIQHEIEHLDGIIFYENASLYHREQAYRKRDRIRRNR